MGLLTPGEYKIELWGAASGFPQFSYGNYGAYVRGTISIQSPTIFYVYLGQRGTTSTSPTYNGGTPGNPNIYAVTSGGGASDIRLIPGDWNSFESLKSRIMVAGAAGGCCNHHFGANSGGGGSFNGEDGAFTINTYCLESYCNNQIQGRCYNTIPTGGSQTSSGIDALTGYTTTESSVDSVTDKRTGKFGIGGYSSGYVSPPGGSGYYGGGSGIDSSCVISCGAGGSSFVSGLTGCNAVNISSSSFDNILHTNQSVHYSGYQFTDAIMLNGSSSEIPQHFYDGACQITILSEIISFIRTCRASFISSKTFFLTFLVFIQT